MILRRIADHVRGHDWFAVIVEFLIVVLGVFVATQVDNWNQAKAQQRKTELIVQSLRQDLRDAVGVQQRFIAEVDAGLGAFEAARKRGETPLPYYRRISGSDTPPTYVWQAALQSDLVDLLHPGLMFDLGYYYSEVDGVGAKYARYARFVESEILPRLSEGPSAFYDGEGRLLPAFAANLDRLREWRSYVAALTDSARCLDSRFDRPAEAGRSCRPDYHALTAP